jgi:hypothetical protein
MTIKQGVATTIVTLVRGDRYEFAVRVNGAAAGFVADEPPPLGAGARPAPDALLGASVHVPGGVARVRDAPAKQASRSQSVQERASSSPRRAPDSNASSTKYRQREPRAAASRAATSSAESGVPPIAQAPAHRQGHKRSGLSMRSFSRSSWIRIFASQPSLHGRSRCTIAPVINGKGGKDAHETGRILGGQLVSVLRQPGLVVNPPTGAGRGSAVPAAASR